MKRPTHIYAFTVLLTGFGTVLSLCALSFWYFPGRLPMRVIPSLLFIATALLFTSAILLRSREELARLYRERELSAHWATLERLAKVSEGQPMEKVLFTEIIELTKGKDGYPKNFFRDFSVTQRKRIAIRAWENAVEHRRLLQSPRCSPEEKNLLRRNLRALEYLLNELHERGNGGLALLG